MTRHLPTAALIAVLTTAFMCGAVAWVQRASPAASQSAPQAVGSTHADAGAVSNFIGDVR